MKKPAPIKKKPIPKQEPKRLRAKFSMTCRDGGKAEIDGSVPVRLSGELMAVWHRLIELTGATD